MQYTTEVCIRVYICVYVSESGRAVAASSSEWCDRSVANTRRLSSWWGNTCLLLVLNSLSNYISSHTFILFFFVAVLTREIAPTSVFFFSLICILRILLFYYRNLLLLSISLSLFLSSLGKDIHNVIRVFHERNRRTVPKIDTRTRE